jgi:S-DNA-T family DNA segregation ATPase FtsK/SpoIIIE
LSPAKTPWRPPLPDRVDLGALAATCQADPDSPDRPIILGLADHPAELRQDCLAVPQGQADLLIIGAPGSGRTNAARLIAWQALQRGRPVHVITATESAFADLAEHQHFGTLAPLAEPRLVGRLLSLLRDQPQDPDTVLVIDDADCLGQLPNGPIDGHPLDRWPGTRPWTIATCTARGATGRWCANFPARLVLPTVERAEDLLLGVPTGLAGPRTTAGRAVWLHRGESGLVQLAAAPTGPAPLPLPAPSTGPSLPTAEHSGPPAPVQSDQFDLDRRATGPGNSIIRLRPLPRQVRLTALPPSRPGAVWLGIGGDEAQALELELLPGQVVGIIGPHASGRTTVLRTIGSQLAASAQPHWLADVTEPDPWGAIVAQLAGGKTVLVDDADELAGLPPPALPPDGCLVVVLSTARAIGFSGLAPLLRLRPHGVVLWPETPGGSEVFGVKLNEAFDPRANRRPGFGAHVRRGSVSPVQCAI